MPGEAEAGPKARCQWQGKDQQVKGDTPEASTGTRTPLTQGEDHQGESAEEPHPSHPSLLLPWPA